MELKDAINSRRSIRAYLPTPVDRDLLNTLLQTASRAPSNTNVQSWRVYVLQGNSKDALISKVCKAHDLMWLKPNTKSAYVGQSINASPSAWVAPYLDRRQENGRSYYSLLGIPKEDRKAIHSTQQQNFKFFGAPVGIFFTINKTAPESWLTDIGMFMQTFALAAKEAGLDTCFQGAWSSFGKLVMPHISAGEDELLVCGMSLGYADTDAKINTFTTPRALVEDFTKWLDK
jgi:nitroreductase